MGGQIGLFDHVDDTQVDVAENVVDAFGLVAGDVDAVTGQQGHQLMGRIAARQIAELRLHFAGHLFQRRQTSLVALGPLAALVLARFALRFCRVQLTRCGYQYIGFIRYLILFIRHLIMNLLFLFVI